MNYKLKMLEDFSENLINTKYQEDTLYYMMLLCSLEMFKAERCSFLLYEIQ